MHFFEHELRITDKQSLVNITKQVRSDLQLSGVKEGIVVVFCPHTTAGITINENADPDVQTDLIYGFEKAFSTRDRNYLHFEGNSHAHLKSSTVGASQNIIIHEGNLVLGIWQSIYFCEFDGPRYRKYCIKIMEC